MLANAVPGERDLPGVGDVVERAPEDAFRNPGISSVTFQVMDDEEVLACAVAAVDTLTAWREGSDRPEPGGLLDARFGALDSRIDCGTCFGPAETCPGHFGAMHLPRAVLHANSMQRVLLLLRLHCHACGELLVWGARRRAALAKAAAALARGGDQDAALLTLAAALPSLKSRPSGEDKFRVCRPAAGDAQDTNNWCGRVQPFYQLAKGKSRVGGGFSASSSASGGGGGGRAARARHGSAWFPLTASWPDVEPARATTPFIEQAGVAGSSFAMTGERVALLLGNGPILAGVERTGLVPSVFAARDDARTYMRSLTLRVLPVAPLPVRPTGGVPEAVALRSAAPLRLNDLTKRYGCVLEAAFSLAKDVTRAKRGPPLRGTYPAPGAPGGQFAVISRCWEPSIVEDQVISDSYVALQQAVDALFNRKDAAKAPAKKSRFALRNDARSLGTDMEGKAGLMRGHIQGKRGDFAARTVITPDPALPMGTLAVPRRAADVLTVPVRCTDLNCQQLTALASDKDLAVELRGRRCSTRSLFLPRSDGAPPDHGAGGRDLNWKPWGTDDDGDVPIGSVVEVTLPQAVEALGMDVHGVFNRQPTLHRPSMLAMRLIITPGQRKTFAFNEKQVTPFNADFDGDEMNLTLAQSLPARAELATLMPVAEHCRLPKNGSAAYGCIQDTLTAAWELTSKETLLRRDDAMDLVMAASCQYGLPAHRQLPVTALPQPAIVKSPHGPRWTGKQLASLALPRWLHVNRPSDQDAEECVASGRPDDAAPVPWPWSDTGLCIVSGELLCGRFDKQSIGASRGSLALVIESSERGGAAAAEDFLNGVSAVCRQFFMQQGFSVGMADIMLAREPARRAAREVAAIDAIMCTAIMEHETAAAAAGEEAAEKEEEDPSARIDRLEIALNKAQEGCRNRAGEIATKAAMCTTEQRLSKFLVMAKAGAKGSALNYHQVTTCMGGQLIQGRRVVDRYTGQSETPPSAAHRKTVVLRVDGGLLIKREARLLSRTLLLGVRGGIRPLPHFRDHDYPLADAGGFVRSSLLQGLTPWEFYFHAMGGREGIKNTASDTADTGYAQRRMIKTLEDVHVAYDGTVRNCNGIVQQFWYGLDPSRAKSIDPPREWADRNARCRWREGELGSEPGDGETAEAAERQRCILEILDRCSRTGASAAVPVPESVRAVIGDCLASDRVHARLQAAMFDALAVCRSGGGGEAAGPARCWLRGDAEAVAVQQAWARRAAAVCAEHGHELATASHVRVAVANWVRDTLHAVHATPCLAFEADVRVWLSSRNATRFLLLTRQQLARILARLGAVHRKALPTPGDAVGVIAAQGIGETATQKTLNSFHVAGSSAAMVGGGERFAQLGAATPAEKQNGRFAIVRFGEGLQQAAFQAKHCLQSRTFGDLLTGYRVAYSPLEARVVAAGAPLATTQHSGRRYTVRWQPRDIAAMVDGGQGEQDAAIERQVIGDYYEMLPTRDVEWCETPAAAAAAAATAGTHCPETSEKVAAVDEYCMPDIDDASFGGAHEKWCAASRKRTASADELRSVPSCVGAFVVVLGLRADWFERVGLAAGNLEAVAEYVRVVLLRGEAYVWITPDTNAATAFDGDEAARNGRSVRLYIRAKTCKFAEPPQRNGQVALVGAKRKRSDADDADDADEDDDAPKPAQTPLSDVTFRGEDRELAALRALVQRLLDGRVAGPTSKDFCTATIEKQGAELFCDTYNLQYLLSLDLFPPAAAAAVAAAGDANGAASVSTVDRTRTNQVSQVYELFGIEAARALLASEFSDMVSNGGGSVAVQHTQFVSDVMCQTGEVLAFSWHAMGKRHDDFLLRASFERTAEVLHKAALGGKTLDTRFMTPSASICLGAVPQTVGTGMFDTRLDAEALRSGPAPVYVPGAFEAAQLVRKRERAAAAKHALPAPLPLPDWMRAMAQQQQSGSNDDEDGNDNDDNDVSWRKSPGFTGRDRMHDDDDNDDNDDNDDSGPQRCTFSPVHESFFADVTFSPVPLQSAFTYSPSASAYSPSSPWFSASSPGYSPSSPSYSPSSPGYSPSSPRYSPSSPGYSPSSPGYSPSSPSYSPTSPGHCASLPVYSPSSPTYAASSPAYDPSSPVYDSFASPAYSPSSASAGCHTGQEHMSIVRFEDGNVVQQFL